jgi:hypothetical protein
MEKRTFVKLCKLQDITYEMDSAETQARWVANVLNSVGEDGYGLADAEGEYITAEFTTDEIEFVTVDCYYFMGSAFEQERFYRQDFITVRDKATGNIWAYETEEILEGAF